MQRIVDETLRRGRLATHFVAGTILLALVNACGTDKGVAPIPPPGSVSQEAGLQKLTEFGGIFDTYEFSLYTLDDAGANDDPAQSDLNKFARADNVTGKIGVAWAWDDIDSWTGSGQTGDACALFEIDVGGTTPPDPGLNNADFALCVRITNPDGSAATTVQLPHPESPLLYQCGDKKTDRCTTSFSLVPFNNTQLRCEVLRTGEAVFPTPPINGDDGQDVLAACALDLSLLGNAPIANVKLLNVCSYPSGSPNSNPFDCVVTPGSGFLRIQKVAQGTANTNFGFTLSPAAEDEQTSYTVNPTVEGGLTALIPVDPTKSYTITESTIPAGWDLSSAACGGTTGTGTFVAADKKITGIIVAVGETKICTFTNAQSGSITIVKDATPNDQQDFAFSGNITGCTSFTLDDDAGATGESSTNSNQKVCPLTSGTYSVDETVPSGWVKTSATCSDGSAIGSIAVSPGESVTCTFTNTKQAKLRIVKATNPDADPADFTFTPTNWNGGTTFQRRDNQAAFESAYLAPGTTNYTTTETVPEGWTLSNRECVHTVGGAAKTFTSPTNGITVQLAAGEDVTCTFTNTKGGTITIIKDAIPNDQQGFVFAGNITGCTSFTLDDDEGATGASSTNSNQQVCAVAPGTYNVDETVPSGWVKTSATCSDGSAIGSIDVSAGESVTCTFTNTKQAKLRIVKATNPDADPADFTFTPTNWNGGTTFQRRDNQAAFESAFLAPGATNYTTTETVPSAWTITNRECVHTAGGAPKTFTSPANGITVQLAAGEDVTCTFTNTRKTGTIKVDKAWVGPGGQTTLKIGTTAGGSEVKSQVTGSAGAAPLTTGAQTVNIGTYYVAESGGLDNYTTSLSCMDGATPLTIGAGNSVTVAENSTVVCTFTNTRKPKLSITKTPDRDGAGYTVKPGEKAIFTITVSNAADGGAASNVKIEDILPAGLGDWVENPDKTECTITPVNAGEDDRKLACTITTLNTGASFSVTVEAMIPSNFLLKPPSLETTPIEIDGNLADDPDDGAEKDGKDWASLGLNCTSTPKVGCSIDKPTGGTDDSFGNGTKEDTPVPSIVAGQIPNNKSDLLRFYVATQRIVTTDYLYLAWERVQEPSGTTNMDFELNQSDELSANGVTPVRSEDDVLITYDLAQGGVNPILGYHRWVLSGACAGNGAKPPCWGPRNELTTNVAGAINTGVVVDPINPGADRNLSARTFGEARINLPASGIFGSGICTVFGSAYLKSRSSDSFSAAIKDFIAPVAIDVSNCEAKELLNEARAQASNYAPPGGALNDWFADSGQILVSDETTGSSFRTRSTVREAANGRGSGTVRRSRTFFDRNDD